MPLLDVSDIQAYFKTSAGLARAVDGVSFSIDKGNTLALVGESGCGKSTIALAIMNLLPKPAGGIHGGQILFDGTDLTRLNERDMRNIRGNRIAMIFQEPMTSLNPVIAVGEQVAEAVRLHQGKSRSEARDVCVDMFTRVGIPDPGRRYGEYPHQLSGGMKQRVMIAMALCCEPDLLIADEPTTALDVTIQAQILELIRDLQNEMGMALILITHDLGIVSETAENVCVMYGGKIVESAARKDLFERPLHPYTIKLLESLPSKNKRGKGLSIIKGNVPPATRFPSGCRFAPRCPLAMDMCREQVPEEIRAAAGHTAACFLFKESRERLADATKEPLADHGESSKAEDKIITASSLCVHFPIRKGLFKSVVGHVRAVDGLDIELSRGRTLALVGESGCGKTTTGLSILNLVKPTGGSVRFKKEEIAGMSNKNMRPLRRHMQIIFQDPYSSLNPRMMIGDIIEEGMKVHNIGGGSAERQKIIAQTLEEVGLDGSVMDRYPHEFSGGQRQRIGIARAIVLDPEFIVCDEATSSLDVSVQAQILNLLKRLQIERNIAYLFITHDLSVVEYMADYVAVMYLGRVVEYGTVSEVFESTSHPYTRSLISAIPRVDKSGVKKIRLEGDVPSPVNPPPGCHFHPRCPVYAEKIPPMNPRGFHKESCPAEYPDKTGLGGSHYVRCYGCKGLNRTDE